MAIEPCQRAGDADTRRRRRDEVWRRYAAPDFIPKRRDRDNYPGVTLFREATRAAIVIDNLHSDQVVEVLIVGCTKGLEREVVNDQQWHTHELLKLTFV